MIQLLPYQVPSAENLLRSLREHRIAVDASDTGTGKTFVAAWIVEQEKCPVVVVCPKAVIPVWKRLLPAHARIINYEKLRTGNTPLGKFEVKKWVWGNITIGEHGVNGYFAPDTLIIFDEVHRCKSPTSQNGRILAHSKPFNVLTLSATLAQDPTEMKAIGYLLGLHGYRNFFKWCLANGCWRGAFGGLEFKKKTAAKHLLNLHSQIFPSKGSRIRIADLGDQFPDNLVTADVYSFGNEKAVDKAYEDAETERDRRALAGEPENVGALQMQARAKAEAVKADGLAAMATDLIEEGNSVVIFTSFRETLEKLRAKLKCGGVYGGQADSERSVMIDQFQRDVTRVIVVNIAAGGQGISLHDLWGRYPRVSLICPTFHAVDLKQALGRIHRAGAKSKAVQKIVYAAGTIEERICRRVQAKLRNIELLQDGDLDALQKELPRHLQKSFGDVSPEARAAEPHWIAQSNELSTYSSQKLLQPLQVADTCVKSVEVNETVLASTLVNKEGHGFTIPRIEADLQTTKSRKHAPLSPSKLKAKSICPGYINDPSGDSKWADRGTLGHKAVEIEDTSICGDDAGLIAAVKKCIAYKHTLIPKYGSIEVHEEVRLDYLDQFGYADIVVINGLNADVIDWKFAVNFYAADSPQFWAYAIAIFDKWPVETLRVHVPHPFRDEIDVETWTRTADYERLSGQVAAIIAKAKRNNPSDYRVSAQCNYCGLAQRCSKLARLGCDIARHYAPEMALPDLALHGSEITDPKVFAALLPLAPLIEKATGGWKYAARELAESGVDIPGYEMAEKKGRRVVVSAKAAYEAIRAEVAPDLAAEDFIDSCDIKASAVDDLVRAASPRGQKAKAVERVQNLLVEGDIFNQGGDVKYLRPIRR